VPGVSPAAKQMGRAAAANILRRCQGRPPSPSATATTATWPPSAAIRRGGPAHAVRPPKFSGYPAWLFWLFAHVYFLIGFRNRIVVLIDWASAYWSSQRYARVVTDIAPAPAD
jgi:NADH dehydrogenase